MFQERRDMKENRNSNWWFVIFHF